MDTTDATIKRKIGAAIRQQRLACGKTQEQLAFDAGINTTYLSDIERGKRNLAAVNTVKIAQALGLSASELYRLAGL